MHAVDEVQDTPPSSVPPSQPPVLVVGVDCTVQLVPFQRSARGLRFLPVRVVATPVAVHCDRPVQDTPLRKAPLKPGKARWRPAGSSCALLRPWPGSTERASAWPGWAPQPPRGGALLAAGDAAAAAAGPVVIMAPARTVATIPAANAGAAARRDLRRRLIRHLVPPSGAGTPLPLAAPVLALRFPAMPSSVG